MGMIPLVDLAAQHRQVADDVEAGFARVMERTAFILGEEVSAFERAFANFTGVSHCVAVANGTDALELAFRASGIGPGDEVLVPANTFIATALAVSRAGATPAFVDVDPEHLLIAPQQVLERAAPRTKAVCAVHLYGQMAPMAELRAAADRRGLLLIEDAAQAHGASQNGLPIGSAGAAAGVSFYPGKNLGAYGDGGAVITNSHEVAERISKLRNYGGTVKYHHPETGFNSRLDTLQAVVLSAKLKHLARWNDERREASQRYSDMLKDVPGVVCPSTMTGNVHAWHLYVIRVARRDEVLRQLQAADIGAGIHYPIPCHLQGAFSHLGYRKGDFPVSERAAEEILSLPLFPGITSTQQERVVSVLRKAVRHAA